MQPQYKILHSAQFWRDIKNIREYYIKQYKDPNLINVLLEAVDENENGLDIFPDMYGIFESNVSLEHEYRSFKAKNYKVFNFIEWETETVVVNRICYAGMDLKKYNI